MPKVKTLLITVLVIAFALSLTGCGMLLSRRAEPELAASLDGELPEWLLLSHRSENTFEADDLLNPKDTANDEEADETAIGGVDEDDGVTPPSSDQTASTQPAPSSTPSATPSSSSVDKSPKPGERNYLAWFAANGAKPPFDEAMLKWYGATGGNGSYADWKKAEDAKEAAGGDWSIDFTKTDSPSGWGNKKDDDD